MTATTTPSLRQRAAAELAGTALLILVGPGSVMLAARTGSFGNGGIAIAFGVAVAVAVALFGNVSGAHINPAVSVGLALRGRLSASELATYVTVQMLGALVGVGILALTLGPIANFGATTPAATLSVTAAFAVEFAYTGLLGISVALVHRGVVPPRLAPLFLGAVVALGAFLTGPLTGGSFNPARSFAPAVASGVWTAHWIYWLAPIAGFSVGYAWLSLSPAPRPAPSSR